MTKRIEVYLNEGQEMRADVCVTIGELRKERTDYFNTPAVLFIGNDGHPPKVMTEEEHLAKMKALWKEIDDHLRSTGGEMAAMDMSEVAKKHGITL